MKNIEFIYLNKKAFDYCEHPKPSKTFLPEWFLNMRNYENGEKELIVKNRTANFSAKKCTPMFDAMTGGYTIPLWQDVYVENNGDTINVSWEENGGLNIFLLHGKTANDVPVPPGYFAGSVFKFTNWLTIKTPKGYSISIRPPAGHYDLPFLCIPAIVDTDKPVPDLTVPGWIKDGFSGVIKKGTPMVQIFPFKRDDWKSSISHIDEKEFYYSLDKGFGSTLINHYKKNIWSRKTFK